MPRTNTEQLLLYIVYGFFILLLAIPLWYPAKWLRFVVLLLVLLMVIAEAVFVLYYKRDISLCEVCQQTLCS
jgi:hypothetical protein